jgi:glycosyltransferase involved in cell wall biosynthesis
VDALRAVRSREPGYSADDLGAQRGIANLGTPRRHSGNPVEKLFFRTQEWKMRWFERRALLRAAGSTAVTEDDARTLRDWQVPNVTVVPNGVDLDFYSQRSEPERRE